MFQKRSGYDGTGRSDANSSQRVDPSRSSRLSCSSISQGSSTFGSENVDEGIDQQDGVDGEGEEGEE